MASFLFQKIAKFITVNIIVLAEISLNLRKS